VFVVLASYLLLLQDVVTRCGLPYAFVVFKLARDGSPVYGVEIDVPSADKAAPCRSFFFWASTSESQRPGYE
jgi:hypothetical protein